jgi:hypothetical protein
MDGWIGVDFDGTLAVYDGWNGADHCGEPIGEMVFRVKKWLSEGRDVRIFTARISPLDTCVRPGERVRMSNAKSAAAALAMGVDPFRFDEAVRAVRAIRQWCVAHVGRELPITNVKDYGMVELWDDRAVQVESNTGVVVGRSTRGL